ncbi:hypothetical protein BH11ARM1_BH11ARM1_18060 [soil metagenome]
MIDFEVSKLIIANLQDAHETGGPLRAKAMRMLNELPHFDWSGIYRLEGDNLILDEYTGAATDHTIIPVGRGVCGTAVAENANQKIDDVRDLENYLSCSIETRAELVVLIRQEARIIGQIDIDSHQVKAFDDSDIHLLERVATILADRWN